MLPNARQKNERERERRKKLTISVKGKRKENSFRTEEASDEVEAFFREEGGELSGIVCVLYINNKVFFKLFLTV